MARHRQPRSVSEHLTTVMARWSLAHGLAMLLIDGRLDFIMEQASEPDIETFVGAVLATSLP